MPSLHIIFGPDGLLEDTPIFWAEYGALNPLLLDVVSKITEGLGLCVNAKVHKHRSDLVVREEREGHEFSDVLCHRCCRQFKDQGLAPMVDKKLKYVNYIRLTNGLLKAMLHGMTVCPNVLTTVYICFIKKHAKAVKSELTFLHRARWNTQP